jgi:Uma2 family endonuclease
MAALAEHTGLENFSLAGLPMPVTIRLPQALSDQQLIAFSRSIRPYQVERNESGELEIMSPNGLKGASLEAYAMLQLGKWAEEHGGAVISSQGGFTLSDSSVRMADASWITEERWRLMTDQEREGFAHLSPDFLIEIRSRTDSRTKLETKMQAWIANGARLAWMIDPYLATVSIYKPEATVELLLHPDSVEADSVVTGFRLETARMWVE